MNTIICRSCGSNLATIRCLHCVEDRSFLCLDCARHHNEINIFRTHELVPLIPQYVNNRGNGPSSDRFSMPPDRAYMPERGPLPLPDRGHMPIDRVRASPHIGPMTSPDLGLPMNSNYPNPVVSGGGGGINSMGYRTGPAQTPSFHPSDIDSGPSAVSASSRVINKIIHLTPETFGLIRSNALLLDDIKTCTGCKIL